MECLTESHYLPGIRLFSKFLIYDRVNIDKTGFFARQTYRNRCHIVGPNGMHALSIPVKNASHLLRMEEVEIDHSKNWQHVHWHSLKAAYGKSPFFDLYVHEFKGIYEGTPRFLFESNLSIIKLCMKILRLPVERLGIWEGADPFMGTDLRSQIHPKPQKDKKDANFSPAPYMQVWEDRFGFVPGLSIADLIFNEGPEARGVLGKCLA
ncbi:MAG: WbqC family protein [Bacteroidota bacterium]|nr:WbqC family protein [Bacteroidota bacterium]